MGARARWRRTSASSIASTVRSRRILPQMATLGLLGISVPQEYGGAGMDYICLGLASEELEYVDTSLRVIMSVHAGLNCLTLLDAGAPRIRSSGTSCRRRRARRSPATA